jgi:hypothetical protein
MKPNCSLNHPRAAEYSLETKRNICASCIDADRTNCPEGISIIQAFKQQQTQNEELKQKLIAVIEKSDRYQHEIIDKARFDVMLRDVEHLAESTEKARDALKILNNKIDQHDKRFRQLGY